MLVFRTGVPLQIKSFRRYPLRKWFFFGVGRILPIFVLCRHTPCRSESRASSRQRGRPRNSHMKRSGIFVVSPRGINQGLWPYLRCSWRNATIFSCQSIFYGALEEIIKETLLFPFVGLDLSPESGLLAVAPFLNSGWYSSQFRFEWFLPGVK